MSKYSLLYYSTAATLSAGVIMLLIHSVQWPASAEIILGITLFLHSLILARTAKDLFLSAYQNGLISEWFLRLQHGYDMSESKSESEV